MRATSHHLGNECTEKVRSAFEKSPGALLK
jgi:hypothetical protein